MKAMILCAGKGTRLGKLTTHTPKPMLEMGGLPMLEHILINLRKHDIVDIIINLHFMPHVIRDYFGNGLRIGMNISYTYEKGLLGTAGAIKNAESLFKNEDYFMVHYGDILTNQNFTEMLSFHQSKKALATLLVHQRRESNSIVEMNHEGCLTSFLERPTTEEKKNKISHWVNSGIYVFSNTILEMIPPSRKLDFPADIFPNLIKTGRVYGFPLKGWRYAIDSPEKLNEVKQEFATMLPKPQYVIPAKAFRQAQGPERSRRTGIQK
jgi:NDP-sugar pyrophosphorylase family protein